LSFDNNPKLRNNIGMSLIKKFLPTWLSRLLRPIYHGSLAFLANWYYGRPSEQMIVVGITGTAGKSTTAAMLANILNYDKKKCGVITTVDFFDGDRVYINKHGLSMPGGPLLQKSLKQMLNHGCHYAIVECTSEGLAQNRHAGINFDMALLTNFSEAHIQAHGNLYNYRRAKGKLFSSLLKHPKKSFLPKKILGINLDAFSGEYFTDFKADEKFGVTFLERKTSAVSRVYQGKGGPRAALEPEQVFMLENQEFMVKLPGQFNLYNALLALAAANMLGVSLAAAKQAMAGFEGIRGRMEPVPNNRHIKIYVDYGCEPASIKSALTAANDIAHNRIIHVFGSTGGHRDASKRFIFGKTSAELANVSIITNDDVYESNPQEIADNILEGFNSVPKEQRKSEQVMIILDRKAAIKKALLEAKENDLVLITGKGSEQFLVLPGNKRIDWDEVSVVKELL